MRGSRVPSHAGGTIQLPRDAGTIECQVTARDSALSGHAAGENAGLPENISHPRRGLGARYLITSLPARRVRAFSSPLPPEPQTRYQAHRGQRRGSRVSMKPRLLDWGSFAAAIVFLSGTKTAGLLHRDFRSGVPDLCRHWLLRPTGRRRSRYGLWHHRQFQSHFWGGSGRRQRLRACRRDRHHRCFGTLPLFSIATSARRIFSRSPSQDQPAV